MGFNYDGAIDIVANNQTYRNIKGNSKTIMILNGLKHCPFILVVAELLEITEHNLYGLLKYYLGVLVAKEIYEDAGKRRCIKSLELKAKERENLKKVLGL